MVRHLDLYEGQWETYRDETENDGKLLDPMNQGIMGNHWKG